MHKLLQVLAVNEWVIGNRSVLFIGALWVLSPSSLLINSCSWVPSVMKSGSEFLSLCILSFFSERICPVSSFVEFCLAVLSRFTFSLLSELCLWVLLTLLAWFRRFSFFLPCSPPRCGTLYWQLASVIDWDTSNSESHDALSLSLGPGTRCPTVVSWFHRFTYCVAIVDMDRPISIGMGPLNLLRAVEWKTNMPPPTPQSWWFCSGKQPWKM